MKRAVFLDRDGVINRKAAEGEYVTRWEDFHFLPGVAEAISSLDRAGWSVIVISNQRCVAKGLLTIAELEAIHQKMLEELARSGAKLDGIYYCPHDKEPPCACRKPSPRMLLRAAQEHQIDLTSSWMVGDSESDIEAGKRAGCGTIRIVADLPAKSESADCFARSLLEACERVLTATDKIPSRKIPA
jgi:D-glycero-D-manno-heptose 1,7-bisphosphate phosphatase